MAESTALTSSFSKQINHESRSIQQIIEDIARTVLAEGTVLRGSGRRVGCSIPEKGRCARFKKHWLACASSVLMAVQNYRK